MAIFSVIPRIKTVLVVTTWMIGVLGGMLSFLHYENAPGDAGQPSLNWPGTSQATRDATRPQLVMFAHPRCPCTRASLRELAQFMTDCHGSINAQVLFYQPTEDSSAWLQNDLWEMANAIPGVQVMPDLGGRESRLFNIATSGHVVLYDTAGRLTFSGGITASRGHSGDNVGRTTLLQLVRGTSMDRAHTFVFGCQLFNRDS